MFPLASSIEFSLGAELAIALALGVGFGFALERAGFGSARKLTAVFYLYDMAVVKVMFSAVVTTMAGLYVLSISGMLDLSQLYVEPTNLMAQTVGGLLFGAGFLVGGIAPARRWQLSPPAERTVWYSRSACWPASWRMPSSRPSLMIGTRPRQWVN